MLFNKGELEMSKTKNDKEKHTQADIFRKYLQKKYDNSQFSSYREFAKAADINHAYISRMLSGKKETPPSPDVLEKMAKALNVDYVEMMFKAGYLKHYNKDDISIIASNNTTDKFIRLKELLDEMDFKYLRVIDTAKQKGLTPDDLEALVEMAETVQGILAKKELGDKD